MSLNVEVLEQSFELVKPRANEFAASFYENLFALYPEAQPLFAATDMEKQQKKLLNSIILVVESLRQPEALEAVLLDLGFRHVHYGTLPEHYPLVGNALLQTFEQYLQQDWTPEVKQAWADAYEQITKIMFDGARYSPEVITSVATIAPENEVEIPPIPEKPATQPIPEKGIVFEKPATQSIPEKPIVLEKAVTPPTSEKAIVLEKPATPPTPEKAIVLEKPAPSKSTSRESKVELIQSSFEKIKPRGEEFAASFYQNLFETYPEAKPLFANIDMASQEKKLLNSLVIVVEGLRQPEALAGVLRDLGARHVNYGTLKQHYPLVTKIILRTLEQYLEKDWTPDIKTAWLYALGQITKLMFEGAGYIETTAPPPEKVETATKEKTSEVKEKSPSTREKTTPVLDKQEKKTQTNSDDDSQRVQIKEAIGIIIDYLWELGQKAIAFGTDTLNIKEIPGQILAYFSKLREKAIASDTETLNIKEIPGQILEYFWKLPKWAIAIPVALFLIILVNIIDEDSILGTTLDGAETISLIVALVLYIKEIPEHKKEFHYQAWSRIDAAEGLKNSQTRFLAMQDLNEDSVSLRRLRAPGANLEDIQLEKANLNEANLREADLLNANLKQANFSYADLSSAQLSRANLSKANFGFCNLSKSILSSANLSNANLAFADLTNANMSGADLSGASLTGAKLQETYLVGANLKDAQVNIADLSDAYIKGAIMPDGSKHP